MKKMCVCMGVYIGILVRGVCVRFISKCSTQEIATRRVQVGDCVRVCCCSVIFLSLSLCVCTANTPCAALYFHSQQMQRLSFSLAARQAQRSIAAYVLRFTAASHDSVACEECSPQPIKGDRERYTLYNSHRRVVLDMMEEQLMIAAVAAHRSLYDPSHSKYKDTELRSAIWQEIAKDLSMEGLPLEFHVVFMENVVRCKGSKLGKFAKFGKNFRYHLHAV